MCCNNEKYLSIFLFLIGVLGVYGSLKVPITERFTLGPGALPLIYALGVLVFTAALFVTAFGAREKNESSAEPPKIPGKYGIAFFLFNCALAASVHLIGFTAGLILFSWLSLVYVGGWKVKKALLFSMIWTFVLYVLFKLIIGVPFIEGFLFETK